MTRVLIRRRPGEDRHTGQCHVQAEGRTPAAISQDRRELPAARGAARAQARSRPRPFGGARPCRHLGFGRLVFRAVREQISVALSHTDGSARWPRPRQADLNRVITPTVSFERGRGDGRGRARGRPADLGPDPAEGQLCDLGG